MRLFILSVLFLVSSCMPEQTQLVFNSSATDSGKSQFAQVNSILRTKCVSCHNPGNMQKGVNLSYTTEQELLDSGMIVPGKHLDSYLYQALLGIRGVYRMPPSKALDASTIKLFEDYIKGKSETTQDPNLKFELYQAGSFLDADRLALRGFCFVGGSYPIEVLGSDRQKIYDGSMSCANSEALKVEFSASLIGGGVASAVIIRYSDGTGEHKEFSLSKMKSISEIPSTQTDASCVTNNRHIPEYKIRRLSEAQIKAITVDYFAELGIDVSASVSEASINLIYDVPPSGLTQTDFYSRTNLSFGRQNIDGMSRFIDGVFKAVSENPASVGLVVDRCAGLTNSSCVTDVIDRDVRRFFKGRLPSSERSALIAAMSEVSDKFKIISFLMEYAFVHPRFTFDIHDDLIAGSVYSYTDEELLFKTFLHLFDTLPSLSAYSLWYTSGLSPDVFAEGLVEGDPYWRGKFERTAKTFVKEWFDLKPEESITSNTFKALVSQNVPVPQQSGFKANAQNFIINSFGSGIALNQFTFNDLSFADSSSVSGSPFFEITEFPQGEIPVATLAPLLFQPYEFNNIFARGAFVYKRLLCGDFEGVSEPDNAALEESTTGKSTRAHFESLTPQGSSCTSCHDRFNALGFNLEEFEVMGSARSDGIERQFSASGAETERHDIDLRAHLKYMNEFYYTPDIRSAFQAFHAKGVLRKCQTRQIAAYYLREKSTPANRCLFEPLSSSGETHVREYIFELIRSESFRKMRVLDQ